MDTDFECFYRNKSNEQVVYSYIQILHPRTSSDTVCELGTQIDLRLDGCYAYGGYDGWDGWIG